MKALIHLVLYVNQCVWVCVGLGLVHLCVGFIPRRATQAVLWGVFVFGGIALRCIHVLTQKLRESR